MFKAFLKRFILVMLCVFVMVGMFSGCGKKASDTSDEQIVDLDGLDTEVSGNDTSDGKGTDNSANNASGDKGTNTSKGKNGSQNTGDKITPVKLGSINLKGRKVVVYDHNRIATGLTKDNTSQIGKRLQERIAAIEKKYNCKWEWCTASYDTMTASIASGKPVVDIMDIGGPHQLPNFYSSGFLNPLEKYPDSLNFSDSKWYATTTNGAAISGKHYALYYKPEGIDSIGDYQLFYFNKTLLEKCGVNVDEMYASQENGSWNWEAFEKVCAKVKSAGYTPVVDTSVDLYSAMLIANDAQIITKSGASVANSKFTADSTSGKAALDKYLNWYKKGYISINSSADIDKTNFIKGNVGFIVDYVNRIYAADGGYSTMNNVYGFITIPQGPNGKKDIAVKNWFFGLTIPVGVKDEAVIADILSTYCEPLLSSNENATLKTAQFSRYTKDSGSLSTLRSLSSKAVFTPHAYFTNVTSGDKGWLTYYVPQIISGKKTPGAAFSEVKTMYEKSIADMFKKK